MGLAVSAGMAWGTFSQKKDNATDKYDHKIKVLYGNLDNIKVIVNGKTEEYI